MGQRIARVSVRTRTPGGITAPAGEGGFTLIELMVCVVIVAVLAALAYPRYTQHLAGTRLVEARSSLTTIAAGLERCYSRYLTYDAPQCLLPPAPDVLDGYRLTQEVAAGQYLLTAEAIDSVVVPAGCTALSLDQAGERIPDECW